DIFPAFGDFHLSPLLPFRASAANSHGFVTGFDNFSTQARMHSKPSVKWQTLLSCPFNVIVNTGQWIFALFIGADRRDQIPESFRLPNDTHGLDHHCAQTLTLVLGTNGDLDRRLNIRRNAILMVFDRLEEDPIPAAFGEI